jgi:acyl-CoA synthetase (AMP-forming)/AMP-acid ligase II
VGREFSARSVLIMLDNHSDLVLAWAGLSVSATIAVPINTACKGEMLRLWADEDRLASSAKTMNELAAAAGKPSLRTAVGVIVHPTRDPEEGTRRTAEFLEAIYRIAFQELSRWVLVGEERAIAQRLASLVRAGASTVVMIPAVQDCSEHMTSLGAIAEDLRKQAVSVRTH